MDEVIQFLLDREKLGIKLGLERMYLMLDHLNHPEKEIPMIHIAGTNGKGSTVQMLAHSLSEQGYRIGVFTSPSFYGYRGHFFINNEMIDEKSFFELMQEIRPVVQKLDEQGHAPTSFEILTALAFLYFHGKVDLAIIEAGMGGRFDTTNCITPILSVITTISIDHEQFLGDSIQEITNHKAGIIKKNLPVIIGPVDDEAIAVIEKEVEAKKAKLFRYGVDFYVETRGNQNIWLGPNGVMQPFHIQLEGKHQRENGAVALMVLYYLHRFKQFKIDWNYIKESLKHVTIPGRFEKVFSHPTIILDSAHNIAGIEAMIDTAKPYFKRKRQRILFAGFKDKRLIEMIERLEKENVEISLTTFTHERVATKTYYKKILENYAHISFIDDWKNEITTFIAQAPKEDTLFVTGSLHFIMIVRQYLKQRYQNVSKIK